MRTAPVTSRASALPRCRTSALGAIRDDLSWTRQRAGGEGGLHRSCAVVGSADLLRLAPRGAEIDRHEVVIRLNNAPTIGWESVVGSRTSVRVVNHVPLEKWIELANNHSSLAHTADGSEYNRLLCAPGAASLGCLVSRMHASATIQNTIAAYRERFGSHVVMLAGDALHRWSMACNAELGGSTPSGGLLAVLLALATCSGPISLYGFWPFCCRRPTRSGVTLNYKYFQGNRTRFVCCSRGRERMEVEYAFYELLAQRQLVRLVTAPDELTSARAPHSVGALTTHALSAAIHGRASQRTLRTRPQSSTPHASRMKRAI